MFQILPLRREKASSKVRFSSHHLSRTLNAGGWRGRETIARRLAAETSPGRVWAAKGTTCCGKGPIGGDPLALSCVQVRGEERPENRQKCREKGVETRDAERFGSRRRVSTAGAAVSLPPL
jgi:hypothetical protein